MKKKIGILGSTGSIGNNTIEIILNNKKDFDVIFLSTNTNVKKLLSQSLILKPKSVIIFDKKKYIKYKKKYLELKGSGKWIAERLENKYLIENIKCSEYDDTVSEEDLVLKADRTPSLGENKDIKGNIVEYKNSEHNNTKKFKCSYKQNNKS